MKILAVDTSSNVATVAICEDERLLGEYTIHHQKTHSQKLVPMIKELMSSLDLAPKDIDLFAGSIGPGSFTGLRIGITTIKAMAYALKKPVIGVPSLDALAYNIPENERLICPIMDARNKQVYTAIYTWIHGEIVKNSETLGIPIETLIQIMKEKNKKVTFLGDGVGLHKAQLQDELGELCLFVSGKLLLQSAASVAMAAFIQAKQRNFENCFDLVPFYLRKSQAEREYDKKQLTMKNIP